VRSDCHPEHHDIEITTFPMLLQPLKGVNALLGSISRQFVKIDITAAVSRNFQDIYDLPSVTLCERTSSGFLLGKTYLVRLILCP
jgi:hypothetical protein